MEMKDLMWAIKHPDGDLECFTRSKMGSINRYLTGPVGVGGTWAEAVQEGVFCVPFHVTPAKCSNCGRLLTDEVYEVWGKAVCPTCTKFLRSVG